LRQNVATRKNTLLPVADEGERILTVADERMQQTHHRQRKVLRLVDNHRRVIAQWLTLERLLRQQHEIIEIVDSRRPHQALVRLEQRPHGSPIVDIEPDQTARPPAVRVLLERREATPLDDVADLLLPVLEARIPRAV